MRGSRQLLGVDDELQRKPMGNAEGRDWAEPTPAGIMSMSPRLRQVVGNATPLVRLHAQASKLKLYVYEPPATAEWCADSLTRRYPRCMSFQWSGDWELIQRVRAQASHGACTH